MSYGANLADNGDFENGFTSWTKFNGCETIVGGKLRANCAVYAGVQQLMPGSVGKYYWFGADYTTPKTTTGNANLGYHTTPHQGTMNYMANGAQSSVALPTYWMTMSYVEIYDYPADVNEFDDFFYREITPYTYTPPSTEFCAFVEYDEPPMSRKGTPVMLGCRFDPANATGFLVGSNTIHIKRWFRVQSDGLGWSNESKPLISYIPEGLGVACANDEIRFYLKKPSVGWIQEGTLVSTNYNTTAGLILLIAGDINATNYECWPISEESNVFA